MLHRKQCKDYIQNNSEYECCVYVAVLQIYQNQCQ